MLIRVEEAPGKTFNTCTQAFDCAFQHTLLKSQKYPFILVLKFFSVVYLYFATTVLYVLDFKLFLLG